MFVGLLGAVLPSNLLTRTSSNDVHRHYLPSTIATDAVADLLFTHVNPDPVRPSTLCLYTIFLTHEFSSLPVMILLGSAVM
ncbi:hypothetical protein I3842_04G054200 [Carya illinoinensis]|uniref:Uncharacterized protein n=1 Tax=Carya illinoinensis TaxID=32201 RepID=A0A922F5R7_CARIL|nr:hypothetical protein I3842_04G054200 [Carya illinoinensis]